jgi:dynein light chain LC8-type
MKWYILNLLIKEIANHLKERLEERYKDRDLCWHVIVGRNFGGYLTYQEKMYTYFYIGQMGFLVFATVKYINLFILA